MAGLEIFTRVVMELAERDLEKRAAEAGISVEEQRARDQLVNDAREVEAAEAAAELQARRDAAGARRDARRRQLGRDLGLGVACHIGHVVKLSGLGAGSAGDGWDRSTVWHVVIDEPFVSGRLRRSPGDLLCRSRATMGAMTMGVTGRDDWGRDSDPDPDVTPVTCKGCLARLGRGRGKSS